ncbi:hypothetical protein JHK86_009415 [Glycine max]|nr:hypothetical protein JHK86_009415 [Glycine max]
MNFAFTLVNAQYRVRLFIYVPFYYWKRRKEGVCLCLLRILNSFSLLSLKKNVQVVKTQLSLAKFRVQCTPIASA